MSLETHFIAKTTTEAILSTLPGVYLFLSDGFDAVTKLLRVRSWDPNEGHLVDQHLFVAMTLTWLKEINFSFFIINEDLAFQR